MSAYEESILMKDNSSNPIIAECRETLQSYGFSEDFTTMFIEKAVKVLDEYTEHFGEGTRIYYKLVKGLSRVELRVRIDGEPYDIFTHGKEAQKFTIEKILSRNLNTETVKLGYRYFFGTNIISDSIPLSERNKKIFMDPMILSIVFGVLCGIICQHMPWEINRVIVNSVASPVLSVVLDLVSGIMGPVLFISMTTSIISLDDINELTDLGFKVITRFIRITLFIMAVSIAVSAVFFGNFGEGSISLDGNQLIGMFLEVIPTNIVDPFLTNNTGQLVVLGFVMGAGLLLLRGQVKELNTILIQIDEWVMSVMKIIMTVLPAIPFLSIMIAVAKGNGGELLEGWKFILASYIVYTICIAVKAVRTSLLTKISIPEFWRKIKPVVMISLTTGSNAAPMKKMYDVSEEELKIEPGFSSMWIPMSTAMLSPKTTINLILASFMMAQVLSIPVSNSFLMVLIILTMELSLASPGTASAWTIMFATLGIPASYVGVFVAYRVLTANYGAACTEAYYMLEEVEAAHKLGGMVQ